MSVELSPSIIRNIFGFHLLSIKDAQIISHIDSALYDIIIFPDKSVVYTRKRTLTNGNEENKNVKKLKTLPYYVHEDLELLKSIGMSKDDIDLFVQRLDAHDNANLNQYDHIIQKIIDFTDLTTRLK